MSEAKGATLQIGDDIIQPIVMAKIQTAIVEAMGGDTGGLIERVVMAVLTQHRDYNGKACRKGDYGDQGSFVELACRKAIEEATKAALAQYFADHQADLQKMIAAQMKRHQPALVAAFFEGLAGAAKSGYTMKVDFNISNRERS